MIETAVSLVGHLSTPVTLKGQLNEKIKYIEPITQETEIIPTDEEQIITPDEGFTGFSKVTVKSIPEEYIIPTGEIEITENGSYDVVEKAVANVNVPEKVLGTKVIDKNGTYNAIDDDLDGYSSVEVSTSGVDINEYFTDSIPDANYYKALKRVKPVALTGTSLLQVFYQWTGLEEFPKLDTSNIVNFYRMCYGCTNLVTIPELDFSKATNVRQMLNDCSSLVNCGGFKNLGKSYSTNATANDNYYSLQVSSSKLSLQSAINVLNGLYDIASLGVATQTVSFHVNVRTLLTNSSEGMSAVNNAKAKGWTVSGF